MSVRLPVLDPATEQVVAEIVEADGAAVDAAVQAGRRVFEAGTWSQAPVEQRQGVLRRIARAIEARTDELADLESRNTGLLLREAKRRHVGRAARNFDFFADYIGQATGEVYQQNPGYLTTVLREPVGVAALIAPWNAPLALGSMKIAAAIAFGNSCVVKPSEQAPLAVMRMVELFAEAGLPADVVSLVNGRGAVTGEALVSHPQVDLVSFTGGTATGRRIAAAAGAGLKAVTMELGGKSANVIFESADFDRALDAALLGVFDNNGQQCLAGSRILVQRSIADRFIEAFAARTKAIRIGDPRDPATELGPVASAAQRDRVLEFHARALAEGARPLAGGGRPAGLPRGFYVEPVAVEAPSNDLEVCQEEVFGPFATLLRFDTAEEAYALANGTRFGLVSYVWSQDIDQIAQAQERLQSGVVWVNTPVARELRAPFGGFKESGIGAEGGQACETFYTRQKTVMAPRRPVVLERLGAG